MSSSLRIKTKVMLLYLSLVEGANEEWNGNTKNLRYHLHFRQINFNNSRIYACRSIRELTSVADLIWILSNRWCSSAHQAWWVLYKAGGTVKMGATWKQGQTNFFLYYIYICICVHLSVLKPVASFNRKEKKKKKNDGSIMIRINEFAINSSMTDVIEHKIEII